MDRSMKRDGIDDLNAPPHDALLDGATTAEELDATIEPATADDPADDRVGNAGQNADGSFSNKGGLED
jgi:hypothetical protein